MLEVEVDPGAGFCFGVEQVMQTAENRLEKGEKLYGLGQMVHNGQEMERLHRMGFHTISHEDLKDLEGVQVLFRAHGEPPSTYRLAEEYKLQVIDGTCPIVLKLQQKIKKTYASMDPEKEQIVIFGKLEHPETIGLLGQVNGDAVVLGSPGECHLVDPVKSVFLFSQTTMDQDQFREVERRLKEQSGNLESAFFKSACTICGQMKKRKPGLQVFALKHDVVVFVSGKNSSNGKLLLEFCRTINERTYWVSRKEDIQKAWFEGAGSIGISGATSTSRRQLEEVAKHINNFILE